jgi:hypothetical protein
MDQPSAGETTSDSVRTRRGRMRTQARALRPVASPEPDGFATPEWLERSFVLPLSRPAVTDVPSQSVPDHDKLFEAHLVGSPAPEAAAEPAPAFVRPPSREIDFARVIRRADLSRTATRAAMASTGIAGLALIAYLLTTSAVVLGMAIALAGVALVAVGVRVRLATAPIPHLER